jgi:hypothetical protein
MKDTKTKTKVKKKLIGGSDRIKPRSSGASDYVNNKGLLAALEEFGKQKRKAKREKLPPPQLSDYVGKCILLICNRLSLNKNFIGYTYRDEMVSDGIEKCTAAVQNNFDPKKSTNPFGYLTQIAWNAFIARIQREKKQSYIKHKNFINSYMLDAHFDEDNNKGQAQSGSTLVDDFISKFEEGIAKNKAKIKKKKGVEFFEEK